MDQIVWYSACPLKVLEFILSVQVARCSVLLTGLDLSRSQDALKARTHRVRVSRGQTCRFVWRSQEFVVLIQGCRLFHLILV
eukprot:733276-Amphidinium_carterae.1